MLNMYVWQACIFVVISLCLFVFVNVLTFIDLVTNIYTQRKDVHN